MINNLILPMNGVLQKDSMKEVLGKCHLLGQVTEMRAVNIPGKPSDLFNVFLVEMPLAPFFSRLHVWKHLRSTECWNTVQVLLHKCYLEAFYKFCRNHDDIAAEIMCPILESEADICDFIITLNSLGMELSKDDQRPSTGPVASSIPWCCTCWAKQMKTSNRWREAGTTMKYASLWGRGWWQWEKVTGGCVLWAWGRHDMLVFNKKFQCGYFMVTQNRRNKKWDTLCGLQNASHEDIQLKLIATFLLYNPAWGLGGRKLKMWRACYWGK